MTGRAGQFLSACYHHLRVRPKTVLVSAGITFALLMIVGGSWFLIVSRQAALEDSKRELHLLTLALSEATERGFESAGILQTNVIERIKAAGADTSDDVRRLMGTPEIHALLKEEIQNNGLIDALTIVDGSGKLINFSRSWPIPDVDVTDRDYFKTLRQNPAADDYIAEPVRNRANGTWTIFIARRITTRSGEFAGLVLAAMNVSYFEQAYSSFNLPDGRITLYRTNGIPLARYPHIDHEFNRSYSSLPIFQQDAHTGASGVITISSLSDGKSTARLFSFDQMKKYPAIVTVSKGVGAALVNWWRLSEILGSATLFIIALTGTTIFCWLRVMDEQRISAETELEAQKSVAHHSQRFELALNNMLHGLSMYSYQDEMIVCNQIYIDMYKLPQSLTVPGTPKTSVITYIERTFGLEPATMPRNDAQHIGAVSGSGRELTALVDMPDGRHILVRWRYVQGGYLAIHEDITARHKTESHLTYLARHDPLTGLFNRHVFEERMEEALARTQAGDAFAVLCIDLDHFKEINDLLGHLTGDLLIQAVAGRLSSCVRPDDTLARIGGDEFAIIQSSISGSGDAAAMAERIVTHLSEPYEIDGHKINICASAGIACAPQDGLDGTRLLSKADIALYQAKCDGRRSYRFFEPEMDAKLQARRSLENDLRQAVDRNEFELHYQPLVDTRTRKVVSFEALIRWNHPDSGLIMPGDFIAAAEDTGLIVPIGAWVLKTACAEAAAWTGRTRVSVNISVKQFADGNIVETVADVLSSTGLAPARLELEITESVLLHEEDNNLATLHALQGLGVKIVMDDFGTGYSSLNYLRVFPFDKLKIDKSFVQNLDQPSANAIVHSVAQLGKKLGLRVTAEGIETSQQLDTILELGFAEAQGYFFSPAVPAAAVSALLRGPRKRQNAA